MTIRRNAIDGLTNEDQAALKAASIDSAEAFWRRITDDPDLIDKLGLPDAPSRQRVLQAMVVRAKDRAGRIAASAVADHLLDIVIVLVIAAVVMAMVRKGLRPETSTRSVVAVFAEGGIAPFHVIQAGEVSTVPLAADTESVVTPEQAVGRYPLEYLPKGRPIDRSKLSAGQTLSRELTDLQIIQIRLAIDRIAPTVIPPVKVSLMATAGSSGMLLSGVYVLDLHRQDDGMVATIATSAENVQKVAPFLAGGKITPVWPSR